MHAIDCPHCKQATLRHLCVVRATPERPVRCKACGKTSYMPRWVALCCVGMLEAAICGGAVLALWQQNAWLFLACLALPAAFMLAAARVVPLRVSSKVWPTAYPLR
ncbi:MAG TPA: hypothetical protein VGC21_09165 [Telluria sp.]|jgi:ABC-type uncharacterized transport system permease subunit